MAKTFVLRTDASNPGLGAVLFQEESDCLCPVSYASRKLLTRETHYSTIERECLAIVWGVATFARYLWGQKFVLQTDHRPLAFLMSGRYQNSRIMRWALSLQQFCFDIHPVQGIVNIFADMLSRSDKDQVLP